MYVEEVVGEVEALGSVGGGLFFIIGALLVKQGARRGVPLYAYLGEPPKIRMIFFNKKIKLLACSHIKRMCHFFGS